MDKKFKRLEKENAKVNPGTHLVQDQYKNKIHGHMTKIVYVVRNKVR